MDAPPLCEVRRRKLAVAPTAGVRDDPGVDPEAVIERVIAVEALPAGSRGSRRLLVAWSDGSEGGALGFYDDKLLFSEGDLVGLTAGQVRALHQRRDVQYLREP